MVLTLDKIASPDYRKQLNQLAAEGKWAGSGQRYAAEAWLLATNVGAKSILDYGAGPGFLKLALRECPIRVYEFDPGIPGKDAMPKPADVVVCTDVLEHVEPNRLHFVLKHLFDLTDKAGYFVVAVRPADKRLPDGRNAHLIIDTPRWWFDELSKFNWKVRLHHGCVIDPDNAHFVVRKL